jgi:hypothetical protein
MKRILCLHGYCQNAKIFSQKIGSLRKQLLKIGYQCEFVDGYQKPTSSFVENNPEPEHCWWNSNEDRTVYIGLEDSLNKLTDHIKKHGPFDGILGFSQGAAMASVIAQVANPSFIILIGGFLPRAENALKWINFNGPSLHVFGEKDEMVPLSGSLLLAAKMAGVEEITPTDLHVGNATLLKHKNGHVVPGAKEYTSFICDWITNLQDADVPGKL